MFYAVK